MKGRDVDIFPSRRVDPASVDLIGDITCYDYLKVGIYVQEEGSRLVRGNGTFIAAG